MARRDFLVEIGTEELPPKSLFTLARAFADGVAERLGAAGLKHEGVEWFATPRRLAVRVARLVDRQPDQEVKRLGPAVAAAFDTTGQPTRAALGFAASCGVDVQQLEQADGPKGKVLQYRAVKPGSEAIALLGDIVAGALHALPIARRMRWGAGDQEFVRPVHWVVMLFGTTVVDAEVLGVRSGKHTRGHRFHAPGKVAIASPARYLEVLETRGRVLADAVRRREAIREGVTAVAGELGGHAVIDEALLEEVTALVEWPVPLAGQFDERFLALPQEVPIATMQDHQRYFPVRDPAGRLMNRFVTVANIESRDPQKVRDGNERVVRPRLADASFFWETDRKLSLAARRAALKEVTFQNKLGSMYDKSERVAGLAVRIAEILGADTTAARRAAELCKCDLLTAMVGEFPELQGVMGRYYAQHDGESADVCEALKEQYQPRFAGDELPSTTTGLIVSMADRLDTLAGIFSIGQKPTGTRDPFGLRRAALGVLRILIERKLDVDLEHLIEAAVAQQPIAAPEGTAGEIWLYMMDRLRSSYLEGETGRGVTTEMFDAVLATRPASPLDIDARLRALESFLALPAAERLASANKRSANILRKSAEDVIGAVETELFEDSAERQLFEHVVAMERAVNPLIARREYTAALDRLAGLREDVDGFFDAVMVMAEDARVRSNRLALLSRLRNLFLKIADLSHLPG